MHFSIVVITDQFPTDDVLGQKLAPYNEHDFYEPFEEGEISEEELDKMPRPLFMWDYWQVGGRYGGRLKLKIDEKDEGYQWSFYAKEARAGRLYRSNMIETKFNRKDSDGFRSFSNMNREEDAYNYLGYRDGYIRVDGCRIRDVIDFEDTVVNGFGFIGKDDTVYLREYWDGDNWIEDKQYEEKVRAAVQDIEDGYVCIVDIHD